MNPAVAVGARIDQKPREASSGHQRPAVVRRVRKKLRDLLPKVLLVSSLVGKIPNDLTSHMNVQPVPDFRNKLIQCPDREGNGKGYFFCINDYINQLIINPPAYFVIWYDICIFTSGSLLCLFL